MNKTTIIIIILTCSCIVGADDFYHDININSTGDAEINIKINVSQQVFNVEQNYNNYEGDNAEKGGIWVAKSIEEYFQDGYNGIRQSKQRIVLALYNFITFHFVPMIREANTTATMCMDYNIINEQRIFDLQKRVEELEYDRK